MKQPIKVVYEVKVLGKSIGLDPNLVIAQKWAQEANLEARIYKTNPQGEKVLVQVVPKTRKSLIDFSIKHRMQE